MKKLTIYHGSEHIVSKPTYSFGKKTNDYGLGFYCTENEELAKEWAVNDKINGYVNRYSLDLNGLNLLDLSSKNFNTLHWITILINNRVFNLKNDICKIGKEFLINNFSIDLTNVDIISGYRADDSYFTYAQNFLDNTISLQTLSKALKYGKLGTQIVLKSKESFSHISFISSEKVDASIYYPLRTKRNEQARLEYLNSLSKPIDKNSIYLSDLVRGVIKLDDLSI